VQRHVDAHAHGQPEHHRPPSRSEGAACQGRRRLGRSRGETHSPKRTWSAAPGARRCGAIQAAVAGRPGVGAFSDGCCPQARPPQATGEGSDRAGIGCGASRQAGRDPARAGISSSLCGWSSRGAAARDEIAPRVCGTANAGCPHAVVNVAPSDAMMLKLGIDFGAGPAADLRHARVGALAADVMESSRPGACSAWGRANCKAH
jgi:hypothetical protein